MKRLTFLAKTPIGYGIYKWKYLCECSDDSTKIIEFEASGNKDQADALAELECDSFCGSRSEPQNELLRNFNSSFNTALKNTHSDEISFTVVIEAIDADFTKVKFCFGKELYLPNTIIKRADFTCLSLTEKSMSQLGRITFDRSSAEGNAIHEMAEIIQLLYNRVNSDSETEVLKPFENLEMWAQCVGSTSCGSGYSFISTEKDIVDYAFNRAVGCQVLAHRRIGNRQIRVTHTGPAGNPCSSSYSGKVYFDVALAD